MRAWTLKDHHYRGKRWGSGGGRMRVGGGGRHEAHGKLPTAVPVCSWTCHDLTDTLGTTGGKDYIRKFQWGPFEHE